MTSYIYDMVDTWNAGATTFTAVKMNVTDTASAAGSLLMDLQVGGSSKAKVAKDGSAVFGGVGISGLGGSGLNIWTPGGSRWQIASSSNVEFNNGGVVHAGFTTNGFFIGGTSYDVLLTRRAAANLRLGAADAAAPVAQTLSVQSVVAGTTNTAGANLTITGSQGTGTGAGGSIVFQVAPAGSSGTAQNALATALTIESTGRVSLGDGSMSAPVFRVGTGTSIQFYSRASGWLTLTDGSVNLFEFSNVSGQRGVFNINSTGALQWCSGGAGNTGGDTVLVRDAANTLALRNGANAQEFNIYRTYTSDSAYERFSFSWAQVSNVALIQTLSVGGTSRDIHLQAGGGNFVLRNTNLTFITDNANDIGASGANRPRNIFAAGYIRAAGANGFWAGSTSFIFWDARTQMSAPASNVLRVDDPSSNAAIIQTRQFTVSNLPSAATYPGSMAFVSDATATTARSTVAGGGSNKVMVMSDGTNWLIVA